MGDLDTTSPNRAVSRGLAILAAEVAETCAKASHHDEETGTHKKRSAPAQRRNETVEKRGQSAPTIGTDAENHGQQPTTTTEVHPIRKDLQAGKKK